MTWGLLITSSADRGLRKARRTELEHIDQAFSEMCIDPFSGDIKYLRGMGAIFRRRVGHWRILFELDKDRHLIIVLAVKRRGSKTY